MRSFIKSHRKANSLDESPAKSSSSSTDLFYSQRPSVDPLVFVPTTPSQISQGGNGSKSSPGFESFHRLANKKMFTSRLFKKSSSANLNSQASLHSYSSKESSSAPGTPQLKRWETNHEFSSSSEDVSKFPAIKGTVKHSWGDHSENAQPVIKLNNPSISSSEGSSDLEPAFRITSSRPDMILNNEALESKRNSVPCTNDTSGRDKQVYMDQSRLKSKNRQVRIHSHDDILHLEKHSSVSLQLLASTATSTTLYEENLDEAKLMDPIISSTYKKPCFGDPGYKYPVENCSDVVKDTLKVVSNSGRISPSSGYEKDMSQSNSSDNLTPSNYNEYDDDEDNSSKFSFEINGINGRTSSVKYYSKPEPPETVYIDDMYEDENFDDDLNFYEDELDDLDFPSNGLHTNFSDDESNSLEDEPPSTKNFNGGARPIKSYKDLFALSDDEDDVDKADLDGGTLSVSNSINYREPNDNTSSVQKNNSIIFNSAIEDDKQYEHKKVPDIESSLNNSKCMVKSALPSPEEELANNSIKSNIRASRQKHKPTAPVKSFADIFDLDDDESDEEDMEEDGEILDENSITAFSFEEGGEIRDEMIHSSDENSELDHSLRLDTSQKNLTSSNIPQTPVQIFISSPNEITTKTPKDVVDPNGNFGISTAPLPPPARSQTFKFHDLNSSLDSEIPGVMSNLYFIDESEEDKYNEKQKMIDDDYIDEINTVPEDFNFSDSDQEMGSFKSPIRSMMKGSFRGTHSYSSQPTGSAMESTPSRNKLEIKNKTVTFFDHTWNRSPCEKQKSPHAVNMISASEIDDNYILSPERNNGGSNKPVTPTNSFSKPIPEYLNDYSLSPIQESNSSVDNSPVRQPH